MLARRFLWIVTGLIVLAIAGVFAFRLFAPDLMRAAFVPSVKFEVRPTESRPDYRKAELWFARPHDGGNPALWTPAGYQPSGTPAASVFFVHPTSYLEKGHWNGPLEDADSQNRARLFIQSQASAFNGVGAIWAPKYRQATIGAFLTEKGDAARAIDLAYDDVVAAFDQFLAETPKDRPIILAGHSQGSFHLVRLLEQRIAGKPLSKRIAAVYVVGWPVSVNGMLPHLGLPPCRAAEDSGCILSWQSFSEPADPEQLIDAYASATATAGGLEAAAPFLCVNPITGTINGSAQASENLGTLVPNAALTEAALQPRAVPARCDSRGLLLIGSDPPELPRYVLPGNNYHVFDYALFWADIRADAERRVQGYLQRDR